MIIGGIVVCESACIEKELKVREVMQMRGIREIAGYIIIFIFSILILKWNDK